jgi:peptidoglycan L-alanyl-D-glutamate endopeptidase CwlK
VEVMRSKARGALLKLSGKSKNGSKSKHTIGRAMDCAFWNGKTITWSVPAEWWSLYGKAAEAHGLVWGGEWRMRDMNHVELS